MITRIPKGQHYLADHGWLRSLFHFSFAEYRDAGNISFGALRVLNDDIIFPQSGFDMHPHRDMEIVTYIIDGELTHEDSMGHRETLGRGEVQYMSAGTGVYHSEYNNHPDKELRLLQMWILPPQRNMQPTYGSHRYSEEERHNNLLQIISTQDGTSPIRLYQDVGFYVSELDDGKRIEYSIDEGRQLYFVQIEGSSAINGVKLEARDAAKITGEQSIVIEAEGRSHFLFIDMRG